MSERLRRGGWEEDALWPPASPLRASELRPRARAGGPPSGITAPMAAGRRARRRREPAAKGSSSSWRDHRDAEPGAASRTCHGAVGRGRRDGDRLDARVLGAEAVGVDDDPAPRGNDALAPVGLAEPGARAGRVVRVDPALAGLVRGVVRPSSQPTPRWSRRLASKQAACIWRPSQRHGMNGDIRRSPASRHDRKATTARARSGAALTARRPGSGARRSAAAAAARGGRGGRRLDRLHHDRA